MEKEEPLHVLMWSGGKDSTATVILAHRHGITLNHVFMAEMMFDTSRGISGEIPEHMEWVRNTAKPLFESWGYRVSIVPALHDYLFYFYKIRQNSKYPENIGKHYGFLMPGTCVLQREKERAARHFLRELRQPYTQMVGVAADEPKRLKKAHAEQKVSLLERYGYTGAMAYDLCKEYGLLSPAYAVSKRGGCWFCPNQRTPELANLKTKHPGLWAELEAMARVENTIARGFKYGIPFQEIAHEVEEYIKSPQLTWGDANLWRS